MTFPAHLLNAHRSKHSSSAPYLYVADYGRSRAAKLGISANPEARANELGAECAWIVFVGSPAIDVEYRLHETLAEAVERVDYEREAYRMSAGALAAFCSGFLARLPWVQPIDYLRWWSWTYQEKVRWSLPLIEALGLREAYLGR